MNKPRSELFNLVAEIAKPPVQNTPALRECDLDWRTGKPFPKPLYGTTDLSPDLELGALRKPLTLEERFFINFGTSMRKQGERDVK